MISYIAYPRGNRNRNDSSSVITPWSTCIAIHCHCTVAADDEFTVLGKLPYNVVFCCVCAAGSACAHSFCNHCCKEACHVKSCKIRCRNKADEHDQHKENRQHFFECLFQSVSLLFYCIFSPKCRFEGDFFVFHREKCCIR